MSQRAQGEAKRPVSPTRKIVWVVVIALVVVTLIYCAHVLWLFMTSTESAVPPASAIQLPPGAEIISESRDCASGGCWRTLEVRPPAGQSPEELADEIGATPQLEISGNLLDPRSIWVLARPDGNILSLTVDYWSQRWVP